MPTRASRSIDTSRAKAMPGVVAVFTGQDLADVNPLPCAWAAGGVENNLNTPRVLAIDTVRWTGDGVAMVIAETLEQANDAAAAIEVDYEPLPVVVDAMQGDRSRRAAAPRERAQQHRHGLDGRRRRWRPTAAIGAAEAVVRQRIVNQRLIPNPMETRGSIGQLRPGHRRVHDLDDEPGAARHAPAAVRLRARHPGAQDALHLARHRRRLRLQDLPLRRHGARRRRLASARPPGQVRRVAPRELHRHDPRPRPRHRHRGRRQPRRHDHRPARDDRRQPRRLSLDDRARHPDHALRPDARRARTSSRTSSARSPASTRTRPWSTPTAAPAGPRRPTSSSARWTCSPTRSGWTRPRCGARTSSRPTRSRTTPSC